MKEHPTGEHPHPVDRFKGAETLLKLSQRLTDWYTEPVTDQEIVDALGADLVSVFRYAQHRLEGKVRNVTLEPAFCHSADIAFRALGLGYPPLALKVGLLHDVVEDSSGSIADVPRIVEDLSEHFPADVVHGVLLMTNRYQLIFKSLVPKVRKDIPFEPRALTAYRAALDVLSAELPQEVVERFAAELQRLACFLEQRASILDGVRIVKRDKRFTVAIHLERQVYHLYAEELVEQAAAAVSGGENQEAITALVVKLLDVIDNVRTSEVSNRLTLFKLANKAEALLDQVQLGFLFRIPAELANPTTIPQLQRTVRLRLVDQLEARRRAVAENFAETRFGGLVGFLGDQAFRLAAKYQVPVDRLEEIEVLEEEIRQINGARA
ncbi:MAG: hypothetical protein JW797_10100 [Bradymonadales bacterium]|nr:hypothetical protein [Bradymonadales bacterium]